jgi:hypothetical protein
MTEKERGLPRVHHHATEAEQEACRVCNPTIAEQVLDQMRMKLRGGICWLIECGDGAVTRYYGGEPGDWCDNPNHAHRYPTQEAAEEICRRYLYNVEGRRVEKHIW